MISKSRAKAITFQALKRFEDRNPDAYYIMVFSTKSSYATSSKDEDYTSTLEFCKGSDKSILFFDIINAAKSAVSELHISKLFGDRNDFDTVFVAIAKNDKVMIVNDWPDKPDSCSNDF